MLTTGRKTAIVPTSVEMSGKGDGQSDLMPRTVTSLLISKGTFIYYVINWGGWVGQSDYHEFITKGVGGRWVGKHIYHVIKAECAAGDFFMYYL